MLGRRLVWADLQHYDPLWNRFVPTTWEGGPETGALEHPLPRSEMGPSLLQVGPFLRSFIARVAGVSGCCGPPCQLFVEGVARVHSPSAQLDNW